jgi:2-dehydro-3-deoxyphosphooctonate aldolase (KDO 8-P synthase)
MKIQNYKVAEPGSDLLFICGPCVIESEKLNLSVAEVLAKTADETGYQIVYKSSFDKANRTSAGSYRGLGLEEGLRILQKVKEDFGLPVLTDVHDYNSQQDLISIAEVVDVLQTPAFLCRQTDFITNVCSLGRPVNVKKGQFLSPWEMVEVGKKAVSTGNEGIMLCERGFSFGYNRLVVDMTSLAFMAGVTPCPIIFDATHSVQLPGGKGSSSGGNRKYVAPLARAAVAVGIDGVFMETHPDPANALSDGPNSVPLDELEDLLESLSNIHDTIRKDFNWE